MTENSQNKAETIPSREGKCERAFSDFTRGVFLCLPYFSSLHFNNKLVYAKY